MNAIQAHMQAHRSIRKYKQKEVPEDVLERILTCATMASSSGNMQAWSVIVTRDEVIKQQLVEPHFGQSMVMEAPVLLTFCADFHRMRRWLELSYAPPNFDNMMSFMIGAIDAVLASQNAALAAESEGLGICYMGTTLANCVKIANVFKCPPHVVPVVGFSMGYPDETPEERKRLPLKSLVHRETYNAPTDAQVLEAYQEREELGWKRYMQDPNLKELASQHQASNLAQVYTKVKYTRESHQEYTRNVLECLKSRGMFEWPLPGRP